MSALQQYLDLFAAQRAAIEAHSPAALNARRAAALDRLQTRGLPGRGDERYKYVDVEAAFAPDYGVNVLRRPLVSGAERAFRCALPGLSAETVYVLGDVVSLDAPRATEEGLRLSRIGAENDGFIGENGALSPFDDGIRALGALLCQDGLVVDVAEGAEIATPVQVVGVSAAAGDVLSSRRLVVRCGSGSRLTLLLCNHSDGRHKYLNIQEVEVVAGRGARIDLVNMQEGRAGTTDFVHYDIVGQAESRVTLVDVNLSGGNVRTTADVRLTGEGAAVLTAGAVVAGGEQRAGTDVLVRHEACACSSEMLHKQVLGGRSAGAFAGRVYVAPGAQQTVGAQRSASLLISPEARAYSQPMLEIYADDVRCNHGSTTGKLDETALFYMRQRGIEEAEARLLLQHAFVSEVLRHIEIEPLRQRVEALVDQRFRGVDGRCGACSLCH